MLCSSFLPVLPTEFNLMLFDDIPSVSFYVFGSHMTENSLAKENHVIAWSLVKKNLKNFS